MTKRVAIIGAGMAGLAVARLLRAAEASCTIMALNISTRVARVFVHWSMTGAPLAMRPAGMTRPSWARRA